MSTTQMCDSGLGVFNASLNNNSPHLSTTDTLWANDLRILLAAVLFAGGIPWYYYTTMNILPEASFGINSGLRVAVLVGFVGLFLHLASGLWMRNQMLFDLQAQFDINRDGTLSMKEARKMLLFLQHVQPDPVKAGQSADSEALDAEHFKFLFQSMDEDADGQFNSSEVDQLIDVIEDVPIFSSPLLQQIGGDDLNSQFYMTLAAGALMLFLAVVSYVMSAPERRATRAKLAAAQQQEQEAVRRLQDARREREEYDRRLRDNAAQLDKLHRDATQETVTPRTASAARHKVEELERYATSFY